MNDSLEDPARFQAYSDFVVQIYKEDLDSAYHLAIDLEEAAKDRGMLFWEAQGLNLQGVILSDRSNFIEAIDRYRRSLAIRKELKDSVAMAGSSINLGICYLQAGQFPAAIAYIEEGIRLLDRDPKISYLASAYHAMSSIYQDLQDITQAKHYANLIIDLKAGEYVDMMAFMTLGELESKSGNHEKGLENARRSLDLARTNGWSPIYSDLERIIGSIFVHLGEFDKAREYFSSSVQHAQQNGQLNNEADALGALGELELRAGDLRRAKRNLEQAYAIRQKLPVSSNRAAILLNLVELYERMDSPKEAIRYASMLRQTNDSLMLLESQRAMHQWEMRRRIEEDSLRMVLERSETAAEHAQVVSAERSYALRYMYVGGGILVIALILGVILRRTRRDKALSERILYNVLPEEVAREIKATGTARSRLIDQVSVLFTDFQGFTELSQRMSHQDLMAEIDACFREFDVIIGRYGVEKIKTIGDSYMAASGLKQDGTKAAVACVNAALDMQDFIETRAREHARDGDPVFKMRLGIHTGPVVAGIVGVKKFQYDVWGDTVNTASRMESSGEAGEVNVSDATYQLVRTMPELNFFDRGAITTKGKGDMQMWFVRRI